MEEDTFNKHAASALTETVHRFNQKNNVLFLTQKLHLPGPGNQKIIFNDSIVLHKLKKMQPQLHVIVKVARDSTLSGIYDSANFFIDNESKEPDTAFINTVQSFDMEAHVDSNGNTMKTLSIRLLDSIQNIVKKRSWVVKQKLYEFHENMQQWAREYRFGYEQQNLKKRIPILKDILQKSLLGNGINTSFRFQVIRTDKGKTAILAPLEMSQKLFPKTYEAVLFPNSFFPQPYFLRVTFPHKQHHLWHAVMGMLFISLAFTLIILFTFAFTLSHIMRQKKLSEMKTDFINNMTHEFKTPLATISLAADTIVSSGVTEHPEAVKSYLKIIKEENKRMNRQVEKVLQMALIDREEITLSFEVVDIHSVIDKAVAHLRLTTEEKGGTIQKSFKAGCYEIPADGVHLENAISNLLDNAIKYSEHKPEILIETFNRGKKLFIRIADNGPGMSKEVQKHAFERFYRKPTGNIHNVKGFGLGLSYVKWVINSHGGEINLSSEPGNGSIFTLIFDCKTSSS